MGVGVVFLRDGKVFLAKRQGSHGEDTWASAGGHLEMGESLEECARREAMEELGVTVGELRFLCVSNILAYDKHYVDIEFWATLANRNLRWPSRKRSPKPTGSLWRNCPLHCSRPWNMRWIVFEKEPTTTQDLFTRKAENWRRTHLGPDL